MRQDFINADDLVNRLTESFNKHRVIIDENAEALKKLQIEYKKVPSDYLKVQREIQASMLQQARTEQQVIRVRQQAERLSQEQIRTTRVQLQLSEAQRLATEQQERAQQRANNELAKAENIYNKVQAKVNQLTGTYNNLAAKRELGIKLSEREKAQLLSLEGRLNRYQTVLRNVDAGIGKYTRNVGNYASGFNPLNNAIGQISRELPNFGQSFSVGVLSLTNNIGALQDAITGLRAQNAALIEQGQPIRSVFSQILSSVLSWQTGLYVGIGIFSAYSRQIGDFVSSLFKGTEAVNAAKESSKQLNDVRVESLKSITQERIELQNNLAIAKDTTLSYDERHIAAQKVLDQYPFWFKNLGEEAILNGKVEKAVKGVNDALLARAKANAAVSKITENQSKIIDIEEQIYTITQNRTKAEERLSAIRRRSYAASEAERGYEAEVNALKDIQDYKNDIIKLNKNIAAYEQINNRLTGYSLQQAKEAIGLDYKEKDAIDDKKLALEDYLTTQYELYKLRLENEAAINKRIFEDESTNYDRRVVAAERYNELLKQLADERIAEQLRVIELEKNAQIKGIEDQIRKREVTERNGISVIYSVQKKAQIESLIAYENYAEDLRKIDISREESLKGVWNGINFQKANTLIDERELQNNLDYVKSLQEIVKGRKDYQEIEKANKAFQIANRDITKANIQLDIDKIETELRGIKDTEANVKKRLDLENQLIEKQKELSKVTIEETQLQTAALEKLQKATEAYLQTFSNGFLSDIGLKSLNTFLLLEENGKTVFANLMEGANNTREKFQVAFTAISEVAQETFAFITQNSKARFEAEYAQLQKEYEINVQYAGDSTDAKEKLDNDYEERKREIRMREAKAQKDQALFNAIINTAQAVVAALPNIPLSIIVGALGAAQIAFIASRQIPAYAEGTDNHPGGLMLVNDAKGSNYREVIQTPDGKTIQPSGRNVLMNAPKGTVVHSAGTFEKSLNDLLSNNSIAPFADVLTRNQLGGLTINNNGGITKDDLDSVMAKYSQRKSFNVNIDRDGINAYWKGQYSKENMIENRINSKIKSS